MAKTSATTKGSSSASVTDPNQQSYTPGPFTIATGKYVIMVKNLTLTGSQQVVLSGTSRLVIL